MRLLDNNGLKAKGIDFSKPQLWRLWKAKKFPAPIKIGKARNAWVEAEVDAWIAERIRARDGAEAA
jgi:prophage regulatory protein